MALVPITRRVQAPFEIQGTQREQVVRFFEPVRLLQVHAELGAEVQPGDPLVEFSASVAAESALALEEAQDRKRALDSTGATIYSAQMQILTAEARRARQEADDVERSKRESWWVYSAELEGLEAQAAMAEQRYARTAQLARTNAVATAQVEADRAARDNAQSAVRARRAARRTEVARLDAQLNAARNEARLAERRRDELEALLADERTTLGDAVGRAERLVERTFGSSDVTDTGVLVRTSEGGTVSFVYTGGQDVQAGETLVKVLAEPQQLYASATLAPEEVGLVNEGAAVSLRLDPYPHYRWGTLSGTVRRVSTTPDAEGFYRCEIQFESGVEFNAPVQPGMPGTVAITTEQRTILRYLFDQSAKFLAESTQ
ncbi:MAG: HlyD family efflux transporter periplasmic adaptor subunit [Bacteroidota bacterium]